MNNKTDDIIIEDAYPLSMLQQGMIFHTWQQPHLGIYHMAHVYRFKIKWDLSLFTKTLEHLIRKHSILRTVFRLDGARPLQLVLKFQKARFNVIDIRNLDEESKEKILVEWIEKEKKDEIDLSSFPWRISVHILSDDEIMFGMTFHHALWDGWSNETFVNELMTTYSQFQKQGTVEASRTPPSYKHFIALEQKALSSIANQRYWQEKFEDAKLPWWSGERLEKSIPFYYEVSEEISRDIIALAGTVEVQEKSIWFAIYAVLLSLLDGTNSIVGSVVIHGRPEVADSENTLGLFLNVLPVRLNIADMNWVEIIRTAEHELQMLHSKRHFPLISVQTQTGLDFSSSMFNFANFHLHGKKNNEQQIVSGGVVEETNYRFSLQIAKDDKSQRHGAYMFADPSVFDEEFRDRIKGYLGNIIKSLLKESTAQVDKARLLGKKETEQLLNDWNITSHVRSSDKCIHELFEEQAERSPCAIALVYEEQQLTYGELNDRSNQLAHYLIEQGVRSEVRVGICVERSLEMVIAILGVLKAGGAYIPIDSSYPQNRIDYLIEDSDVKMIISQSSLATVFHTLASTATKQLIWLDKDNDSLGGINILSSQSTANIKKEKIELTSTNLAYIIYTSGSTGSAKGVLIEHRHITRLFDTTASSYNFNSKDIWTLFHSYAFDFSVWEIWGALIHGGKLVVVPARVSRSPEDFYDLLENERVKVLNQTPTMFNQIIEVDKKRQAKLSLRSVILGGEALDRKRILPWFERHSDQDVQLVNMYGITEITVHGTYQRLYKKDLEFSQNNNIGKKLADLEIYLLDSDLSPVPVGVTAEIFVGGAGVARGYHNRQSLNLSRFIGNPFKPGERLYRSGDLGRFLINGDLEYMGRLDHQVKIRGFRIELGEIENVLLQHEQVNEVIAMTREDEPDNKRLVAYVVGTSIDQMKQDKSNIGTIGRGSETPDSSLLPQPNVKTPVQAAGRYPLSFHQERLWFINEFEKGSLYEGDPSYHNLSAILSISGKVNTALLEKSINELLKCHSILGVEFTESEGDLYQLISDEPVYKLEQQQLPESDESANSHIQCVIKESQQCVAVSDGKLFASKLFNHTSGDSLLLVTMHHIVADRRSLSLFVEEVLRVYTLLEKQQPTRLDYDDKCYLELSLQQKKAGLDSSLLLSNLDYWRLQLSGKVQSLELPIDFERKPIHEYRHACYQFELSQPISSSIENLCKLNSVSEKIVLFSAFKTLLFRYSQQKEIVVGLVSENRTDEVPNLTIGPFSNLLVTRDYLLPKDSFNTLLEKINTTVASAIEHKDIPFDFLTQQLMPTIDMSRTVFFDVLFQFENVGEYFLEGRLGDSRVALIESNLGGGKYDLNVLVQKVNEKHLISVAYNADLYKKSSIEIMFSDFEKIVSVAADSPQHSLDSFVLTGADEYSLKQEQDNNETKTTEPQSVSVNPLKLRKHCKSLLPGYMVPSAIVVLDSMPLTTNGKIDRKALPAPNIAALSDSYVEPKGESERLLADIWCGILKCEQVSRFDNFFELGGHSLLAIQLVSRIRETFTIELMLNKIFELSTLKELAFFIDKETKINNLDSALISSMSEEEAEKLLSDLESN